MEQAARTSRATQRALKKSQKASSTDLIESSANACSARSGRAPVARLPCSLCMSEPRLGRVPMTLVIGSGCAAESSDESESEDPPLGRTVAIVWIISRHITFDHLSFGGSTHGPDAWIFGSLCLGGAASSPRAVPGVRADAWQFLTSHSTVILVNVNTATTTTTSKGA